MEKILYYTPEDKDDSILFTMFLMGIGISLVKIDRRDLNQQAGYLAGLSGFSAQPQLPEALLPDISDKFMILCGFSDERLDELLAFLRSNQLPRVPLKAVLTQTNSRWTAAALYREIKAEHEYMAAQRKDK